MPRLPVLLALLAAACGDSSSSKPSPQSVSPDDAAVIAAVIDAAVAARPSPACGPTLQGEQVASGLRVERIRAAMKPPVPVGDRCLLIVRIDPAVYQLKLLAESEQGQRLSAPEWAAKFDLVAVTNASMFRDDGKSTGLMVNGSHTNNGAVNDQFGAYMAFDPVDPKKSPPVAMSGDGCDGFDLSALRKEYRVVIQNYRLLGCNAEALEWKDDKFYSAAAVGLDTDDHVVFVLQRTPYRPKEFSQMLASEPLRLRAAMYVEGGPEASVYARGGDVVINEIGSYESLFFENDGNAKAWPIPNVIGAAPR